MLKKHNLAMKFWKNCKQGNVKSQSLMKFCLTKYRFSCYFLVVCGGGGQDVIYVKW